MKRVLVVDDETAITEGLIALFEMEKIEAFGASDRASAEAMIDREFYPVILADLRLVTEADGFRLLETIRERSPRSKIASLTAFATPAVEQKLLAMGSSVVLRKPMEFEAIIAIVDEMLAEIEREAEAQQAESGAPLDLVQLYSDVHKILFSIPQRRYGLTADETDELVQEAWCLFLQKRQYVATPGAWLAGTIVNLSRQQIHRNTRMRPAGLEVHSEKESASSDPGEASDSVLMVRQALGRIDERSRRLCTLIGMEGKSYEEVSRELDLPIGSVGPLYIRSKRKLRKALGGEYTAAGLTA
ncbi:MAG TPA: response regulator [Thermoanaerobaculia bacterium]|nr:response regulator [Thermoanaerobaculia bacterium]